MHHLGIYSMPADPAKETPRRVVPSHFQVDDAKSPIDWLLGGPRKMIEGARRAPAVRPHLFEPVGTARFGYLGFAALIAFFTNSSVYVLLRSILLGSNSLLNAAKTFNTVGGPSVGMSPAGLNMFMLAASAAR